MAHPTVGIIGLGYGRAHISAFQVSGCRVVALCQRDEAAARRVADAYRVPEVYGRWQDLLDRAKPEIVVIATPPHLHLPIARAAFERGMHVLCEKPLALTADEGRAIVEAAARANRVGMTAFNWRFTAALQELQALIAEGALGRLLHVHASWLAGRWASESAAATWRMDRAQAGHGAMGDMGVHVVDFIRWCCGDFRRLTAHSGIAYPSRSAPGVARPPDAEDWCTVLGELASGAEVAFTVSRVAHGGNEHGLEVYGTKGAAQYRLTREGPRWWAGALRVAREGGGFEPARPRVPLPVFDGADPIDAIGHGTIAQLVARFLDGIRSGRTPSPSLEDGLRAQEVLDAAATSASRGAWVTL
ncbi:MAG TPA: Gfo/Idh/MocA family oxidoreductase [Candidatus Tectomicrobia bacterium]|nr:Gfo/Idh/MocA family oxidoreductase [Candidatus Tectomicrobia bacterium]